MLRVLPGCWVCQHELGRATGPGVRSAAHVRQRSSLPGLEQEGLTGQRRARALCRQNLGAQLNQVRRTVAAGQQEAVNVQFADIFRDAAGGGGGGGRAAARRAALQQRLAPELMDELRALGEGSMREALEVWGSRDDSRANVLYARAALCADRLGLCEGVERMQTPSGAPPAARTDRCGACQAAATDVFDGLAAAPQERRGLHHAEDALDTLCLDIEMRHELGRDAMVVCDAVLLDHGDALAAAVAARFTEAEHGGDEALIDPLEICEELGECADGPSGSAGMGRPRRRRRRRRGGHAAEVKEASLGGGKVVKVTGIENKGTSAETAAEL